MGYIGRASHNKKKNHNIGQEISHLGEDQVKRLHRHAIFGDVSVSDMCWTRILARLAGHWRPSGVVFFFFFASPTRHQRSTNTPIVGKKNKNKNKNSRFWQMDKSLLLILWYTLEWEVRNLTSETHTAQPLVSFYPSLVLHRADRRAPSVLLSLSISLSFSAWTGPSFSSLSLFRDFFFFLFLLFADCFEPLVWCTVACFIYNTQSFFFLFFFYPTHCYTLLYIYIYIYCFFTQPCLINYNVHYEFSDFCFCVSYYSFIYLLKLNIMYYCITLGVSLLICNSYII